MRTTAIKYWTLLLLSVAAIGQTIQLPETFSQCQPAHSLCTGPCLIATWGPGNGSLCKVSKTMLGGTDGTWGCSDLTTLTRILNNKFCHCEWDYVAAIAIAVDPYPSCVIDPTNQQFWPYAYYCS